MNYLKHGHYCPESVDATLHTKHWACGFLSIGDSRMQAFDTPQVLDPIAIAVVTVAHRRS
jgi:hypothetical protein